MYADNFQLVSIGEAVHIATHPSATASVNSGGSVSISVSAGGTTSPTYQWKKAGVNVSGAQYSGATTATLVINPASAGDAGTYTCVVGGTYANSANASTVTSSGCILTVISAGADRTWTGGSSADDLWSSADNWGGSAPATGDGVVFDGSTRMEPVLDISSMSVYKVAFNSGASSFNLVSTSGKTLTLTGAITESSANTQTIALPIDLSSGNHNIDAASGDISISGVLSGTGSGITKLGNNILTLSGANTYDGTTTVSAGTLTLGSAGVINDTGAVNVNGGTLNLNGNSETVGAVTLTSGTISGAGTLTGSSYALQSGTVGSILAGAGSVTKTTAGVVALNGVNTYSGATTITAGTLKVGLDNAIPSGTGKGDVTVNGTLDINGNNPSINALAGAGTVDNTSGTGTYTLTVGQANANGTFTGTIKNTSGKVALTKTGIGTLTLTSASASTYKGDTTIANGVVSINDTATFGDGTGTLVLSGGILESRNTRTTTASAFKNPVLMTTDTTLRASTTLTSNSRNIGFDNSDFTATAGTLTLRNLGSANTTFTVTFRTIGGWSFTRPVVIGMTDPSDRKVGLVLWNDEQVDDAMFSGKISGYGALTCSSAGTATGGNTILSAANDYAGGTTLQGGYIGFGVDSVGTPGSLVSGPIGTGTLTINDDDALGFYASGGARTVGNAITLAGLAHPLIIKGADELTLSGAINLGTVARTLQVDNSGVTTFSGVINGGPGLTKTGNGTLVLSGDSQYTGATLVSAGTLKVNNSTGKATGVGVVTVGAPASLGGSGTVGGVTLNGTISPGNSAGTLTAGAMTWNGAATYLWEVDDSANDLLNLASLNIAATSGNKFNLNITALTALTGWSSTTAKQWTLVHTTGGITGLDPAAFTLTDNFVAKGNSLGSAGYFSVAQAGNDLVLKFTPLTTVNDAVQRVTSKGVKIAVADLLSNDTATGASITSIDTTGLDGTATLSGGWIFYVPSGADVASDSFTYTLTDANGRTAAATVTINRQSAVNQTRDLTSVTAGSGSFHGVPETSYTVEYADAVEGPWQTLSTVMTDANGLATFTDPTDPLPSQRYYRITYP